MALARRLQPRCCDTARPRARGDGVIRRGGEGRRIAASSVSKRSTSDIAAVPEILPT